MTFADARTLALAAYEAKNPNLDVPQQDFTVPWDVFDAIEREMRFAHAAPPRSWDGAPRVSMRWLGVKMYRGAA